MYAQCTKCAHAFAVTAVRVRQRNGLVRCDHCGHAFNAIPTLTDASMRPHPPPHTDIANPLPPSAIEDVVSGIEEIMPSTQNERDVTEGSEAVAFVDSAETAAVAKHAEGAEVAEHATAHAEHGACTNAARPVAVVASTKSVHLAKTAATATPAAAVLSSASSLPASPSRNPSRKLPVGKAERELLELTNPEIKWQGHRQWSGHRRVRRYQLLHSIVRMCKTAVLSVTLGVALSIAILAALILWPHSPYLETLAHIKMLRPALQWFCEVAGCPMPAGDIY